MYIEGMFGFGEEEIQKHEVCQEKNRSIKLLINYVAFFIRESSDHTGNIR